MKTVVLIDNISDNGLKSEWGLSFYIEHEDKKIILDFGSTDAFYENAQALGISARDVDYAVLSHAHYDHSNGLERFFEVNASAPCFVSAAAKENCYAKKFFFKKYIGLPKGILSEFSKRFVGIEGVTCLSNGVYAVPHSTSGLERIGKREMMFRNENGSWVPDDFSHEQSLVFETEKGLVIFNSCCHGGVKNIISEVRVAFPEKKIYGLIGGLHLFNKSKKEIETAADEIIESGIGFLCTGHCTKSRAFGILERRLGKKLSRLNSGLVIEI